MQQMYLFSLYQYIGHVKRVYHVFHNSLANVANLLPSLQVQGQGRRPIKDLPILMINAIITGLTELSRAYVINTKHIQHIGDILPVGIVKF